MALDSEAQNLFELARGFLGTRGISLHDEQLGIGTFAIVFKGEFGNELCAIRIARKPTNEDSNQEKEFERGVAIWPKTREHPFLSTLYYYLKIPDHGVAGPCERLCTVWQRADTTLARKKPRTIEELCDRLRQIATAVDFLHESSVVHRDIKPENILLTSDLPNSGRYKALLGDLGCATLCDSVLPGTHVGSRPYAHPRQIFGGQVDPLCDVYSLAWVYLDGVMWIRDENAVRPPQAFPCANDRNDDHISRHIESLVADEYKRMQLASILITDVNDFTVTAGELIDKLSIGIPAETAHIGNRRGRSIDSKFIDDANRRIAEPTNALESIGLVPEIAAQLCASAIGITVAQLPSIVANHVSLVGLFHAKELLCELIAMIDLACDAVVQMVQAFTTHRFGDTDNELRVPIASIAFASLAIRRRIDIQQVTWPTYLNLARPIRDLLDVASADLAMIGSGRVPQSMNRDWRQTVSAQISEPNTYELRIPLYRNAMELLASNLRMNRTRVTEFYGQLCNLLDQDRLD